MRRQYSIAAAKDQLPSIVHEVEREGPVELTRRGRPVVVVVPIDEYRRMAGEASRQPGSFWEALQQWRRETDLEALSAEGDPFAGIRDRSPDGGRQFQW